MSGRRRTELSAGTAARRNRARRFPSGRVLGLAAALVGGFVAVAVLGEGAGGLVSALVAALAVVGAVELVLAARRGLGNGAPADDPLAEAVLAASGDAMAVVEDGERVVRSNAAYQRMCRGGAGEAPVPERFLARVPGSQPMVAELLGAVASNATLERAVRFATGPGGRRLEVSVHPLGSPRRVLWTLRMVDETAAQPAASPALDPAPADSAPRAFPAAVPTATAMDGHAPAAGADLLATWEAAPAGLFRIEGGRVLDLNLTACRMLGYALADASPAGLPLREVIAPEDLDRLALAQQEAGAQTLGVSLTRRDGEALPVLLRLAPASVPPGGAVAVALPREALDALTGALAGALAEPVTVPPVAAIAQSALSVVTEPADGAGEPAASVPAAASDLFFLRAPLALALVDQAGRIRAANAAFGRLFGPDAAGRPLSALVSDMAGVEGLLETARRGGEPPAPCDISLSGSSGRSARLYAASLGQGGAADIALCAIDTTEQKQLETQFAESQKIGRAHV